MKKYKNKKVAILGLGLEGKDAVKFLLRQKAKVFIHDRKEKKDLDLNSPAIRKLTFICGKDYLKGLETYDLIVRSPGVYRYLPEIVEAERKGIEIVSVVKIFFDLCQAKIIAVTGTKGKGTTSTLIYEILKKEGKDVYLAGNIGLQCLELLPKLKKTSWVVLELSSFQLIDLYKCARVAVVLNLTTDHMDWHKNRDEYVNAKKNIVKFQTKNDFAVLNYDYKDSRNFLRLTKANKYFFSVRNKVKGSYITLTKPGLVSKIILEIDNRNVIIGNTDKLKIRGKHNWENVCAAVCASSLAGANKTAIKNTIFSFKGLEHRLELVKKVKGVTFYNDSFSTNPQTTEAAINSFDESITLILGGSDKRLNYEELAEKIKNRNNVKNIVLIGEIEKKLYKCLIKAKFGKSIIKMGKTSMQKIVKKAFENTQDGGVVLLSPATASFDMFENYKDRGEKFKKSVCVLNSKNYLLTAGVILVRKDGTVLMNHRDNKLSINYPDYWSLIGGSIDYNESSYDAAKRELLEETGYKTNILKHLITEAYSLPDNRRVKRNIFWTLYDENQKIGCFEGQEMRFVPPSEFKSLKIVPGQEKLFKKALKKIKFLQINSNYG